MLYRAALHITKPDRSHCPSLPHKTPSKIYIFQENSEPLEPVKQCKISSGKFAVRLLQDNQRKHSSMTKVALIAQLPVCGKEAQRLRMEGINTSRGGMETWSSGRMGTSRYSKPLLCRGSTRTGSVSRNFTPPGRAASVHTASSVGVRLRNSTSPAAQSQ